MFLTLGNKGLKAPPFPDPKLALEQYVVNLSDYDYLENDVKTLIKDKVVTDVCAGTGGMSISLIDCAEFIYAVDIDHEALISYRDTIPIEKRSKVDFKVMDVRIKKPPPSDVMICNPPFGDHNKNNFVQILVTLNITKSKHLFLLHSKKTDEEAKELLNNFALVKNHTIHVKIPKVYAHHKEEYIYVECLFQHYIFVGNYDAEELEISDEYKRIIDDSKKVKIKALANRAGVIRRIFLSNFIIQEDDDGLALNFDEVDDYENNILTLEQASEQFNNGRTIKATPQDIGLIDYSYILSAFMRVSASGDQYAMVSRFFYLEIAIFCFEVALSLYTYKREGQLDRLIKLEKVPQEWSIYEDEFKVLKYRNKIEFLAIKMFSTRLTYYKDLVGFSRKIIQELDVLRIAYLDLENWESAIKEVKKRQIFSISDSSDILDITTTLVKLENLETEFDSRSAREKEKRKILEAFFKRTEVFKAIHSSGIAISTGTLGSFLDYINKKMNAVEMSDADRLSLMELRSRAQNLLMADDLKPLSLIISNSLKNLQEVKQRMPECAMDGFEELIQKFKQSMTYEECWHYTLRIKGYMYEVFFSETHKLRFLNETQKPNLEKIIYKFFPDKYTDFCRRCQTNPYIKEYTPDFFLCSRQSVDVFDEKKIELRPGQTTTGHGEISEDTDKAEEEEVGGISDGREDKEYNKKLRRRLIARSSEFMVKNQDTAKTITKLAEEEKDKKKKTKIMYKDKKGQEYDSYLIILEVGYVTANEGKVIADYKKWESALDILASVNIECKLICVSDSTDSLHGSIWIKDEYKNLMLSCTPPIFKALMPNIPPEQTMKITGEISTASIRNMIRVGKPMRSPISDEDILMYVTQNKEHFFLRPSGAKIPENIQAKFLKNLVFGSVMRNSSALEIKNLINANRDDIIKHVKSSNLVFERVGILSYVKFVCGSFSDMIKVKSKSYYIDIREPASNILKSMAKSKDNESQLYYVLSCVRLLLSREKIIGNQIKSNDESTVNTMKLREKWSKEFLDVLPNTENTELSVSDNTTTSSESDRKKRKKLPSKRLHERDKRGQKKALLSPSRDISSESSEEVAEERVLETVLNNSHISSLMLALSKNTNKINQDTPLRNVEKTNLDLLCSAIVPGKSGREKEVKGRIFRLIELFSVERNGFYRDKKGLIISSFRDILYKAGVRGNVPESIMDKLYQRKHKIVDVSIPKDLLSTNDEEKKATMDVEDEIKTLFGDIQHKAAVSEMSDVGVNEKMIEKEARDYNRESETNEKKIKSRRKFPRVMPHDLSKLENEDIRSMDIRQIDEIIYLEKLNPIKVYISPSVKRFVVKVLSDIDKIILKKDSIPKEVNDIICGLKQDIFIVVNHSFEKLITPEDLLKNLGNGSYIEGQSLNSSLYKLLEKSVYKDPLTKIFEQRNRRFAKFKEGNDNRYGLFCEENLFNIAELGNSLTDIDIIGNSPDYIPKFMMDYIKSFYDQYPIYQVALSKIDILFKVLMGLKFFRVLFMYSKVCQLYNNFVSEMSSAGIKLMKIQGMDMNLLCQVGKKKNTNSPCSLLDLDFNTIHGPFFLNRNIATLGQNLCSVLMINLLQIIQNTRTVDVLSTSIIDVLKTVEVIVNKWRNNYVTLIGEMSTGNFDSFENIMISVSNEMREYSKNDILEGSVTIGCYIMTYSYFILVPLMINKRRVSKLMQMYRYPLVLCLSEFGFPEGVGSKLCMTYRTAEEKLFHIFETFCGAVNIKNSSTIISSWNNEHTYNAAGVLSLQIFPQPCHTERQLLSDMYICHIYNKMMDDFSEGSIRVANETFEKIFEFEDMVKKYSDILNDESASDSRKSSAEKKLLMLLGVKNISSKKTSSISSMMLDTDRNSSDHLLLPSRDQSTLSVISDESGSSSSNSTSKSSSVSSYDQIIKSHRRAKSIRSYISGTGTDRLDYVTYHTINTQNIISTVYECSSKMYKFSYGCPEVIQAAYELAKPEYTSININKALADPMNNSQISKIVETTGIVSEPIFEFNLGQSIKILQDRVKIKMSKTLTRAHRQSVQSNVKQKTFTHELAKLLLTDEDSFLKQKETVIALYTELKRESKWKWTDICKNGYKDVIGSDNCNNLFTFIKTLWKDIKKVKLQYKEFWESCSNLNSIIFDHLMREERDELKFSRVESYPKEVIISTTRELRMSLANSIIDKCMEVMPGNKSKDTVNNYFWTNVYKMLQEFEAAENYFIELKLLEKEFPGASFPEYHNKIIGIENKIHTTFQHILYPLTLMILGCQMMSPINFNTKNSLTTIVKLNKQFINMTESEMIGFIEGDNKDIGKLQSLSQTIITVYNLSDVTEFACDFITNKSSYINSTSLKLFVNYCQLLLLKVDRPFESRIASEDLNLKNISGISNAIKAIISRSSLQSTSFDFMMLVTDCIRGGLAICKKLLERKERQLVLPRSTRSKVIYEMINLAKSYGTTSIQTLGFTFMNDPTHRIYAGIAPKAQIGGDRDLQVLEKKSKVMIHVIEACSKSLLKHCSNNDALTNPNKKIEMLKYAQGQMQLARNIHGTDVSTGKQFMRVLNVNGDCAKWGPIHNLAFFSNGIMQLLSEFKDWACAYKLVFLKGITRLLEIPAAVREKIVNSLISDPLFRKDLSRMANVSDESEKRRLMKESVERNWKNNKIVMKLVSWYLSKGSTNVTSYNHMGQGIFHATSSLHGDICYSFLLDIVRAHIESMLPGTVVTIKRVSSSDDYNICITVHGTFPSKQFFTANERYERAMVDSLNLMSGLMRACQMRVSEKTCASPILSEFYSEFCFVDRISPATMKYYTNQIINNSVSTPLSLYQACHVECQQAFYNGVPKMTIIALAILKQLTFINNSIEIFENYGFDLLNSLTICCRLYLPTYTILISSSPALEDLTSIYHVIKKLTRASETSDQKVLREPINGRTNNMRNIRLLPLEEDVEYGESELDKETKHYFSIPIASEIVDRDDNSSDVLSDFKSGDSGSASSEYDFKVERTAITSSQVSDEDKIDGTAIGTDTNMTDVLILLMFKYYTSLNTIVEKDGFNRLKSKEPDTPLVDPFIQLLPESVKSEMSKLKSYKKEVEVIENIYSQSRSISEVIARLCIAQSTGTEDYDVELSRLMQSLSSKDVIWGLTGGSRELSIPFYRQMMRAYFFVNRTPLNCFRSWAKGQTSSYTSGNQKIEPTKRIRFVDFLRTVSKIQIVFEDLGKENEEVDYIHYSDIPMRMTEIISPTDFRFNLPRKIIDKIHEFCMLPYRSIDAFLNEVPNMEYYKQDIVNLKLNYPDNLRFAIVVDISMLGNYKDYLLDIINPMQDSMFRNLINLEKMTSVVVTDSKRTVMTKAVFSKSDTRKVMKNNPAVIIANILSPRSIPESRPTGARFEEIPSDTNIFINAFPGLNKNISLLKEKLNGLEKDVDKLYVKSVVSKLVSTCRILSSVKSTPIGAYCLTEEKSDMSSVSTISLLSNNIIEGKKVKGSEVGYDRSHDDFIYILKACISCINWIGNTQDEKKNLLHRFLRTNLSDFLSNLREVKDCSYCKMLHSFIYKVPEGMVSTLFESESNRYSKEKQRNLLNLAKLEGQTSALIRASSPSTYRPTFDFRGDSKNGTFSFSCAEGTSTGMIVDSILYINLSAPSSALLSALESSILGLVGYGSSNTSPENMKSLFYKMLPKISDYRHENMYFVTLQNKLKYIIRKNVPGFEKDEHRLRYVYVLERAVLATRVEGVEFHAQDFVLKWSDKKLKGVVRTRATSTTYADSIGTLKMIINKTLSKDKSASLIRRLSSGEKEEEVFNIDLPQVAPKESSAIIHALVVHKMFTLHKFSREHIDEDVVKKDNVTLGEEIEDDDAFTGADRLRFMEKAKEAEDNSELVNKILADLHGLQDITPIIILLDYFSIPYERLNYLGYTNGRLNPDGDWKLDVVKGKLTINYWYLIDDFLMVRDMRLSKSTSFLMAVCDWNELYRLHLEDFIDILSGYSKNVIQVYAPVYLFSVFFMGHVFSHYVNKIKKPAIFIKKVSMSNPMIQINDSGYGGISIEREEGKLILILTYKLQGSFSDSEKEKKRKLASFIKSRPNLNTIITTRMSGITFYSKTIMMDQILYVRSSLGDSCRDQKFYHLIVEATNIIHGVNSTDRFCSLLFYVMFNMSIDVSAGLYLLPSMLREKYMAGQSQRNNISEEIIEEMNQDDILNALEQFDEEEKDGDDSDSVNSNELDDDERDWYVRSSIEEKKKKKKKFTAEESRVRIVERGRIKDKKKKKKTAAELNKDGSNSLASTSLQGTRERDRDSDDDDDEYNKFMKQDIIVFDPDF